MVYIGSAILAGTSARTGDTSRAVRANVTEVDREW